MGTRSDRAVSTHGSIVGDSDEAQGTTITTRTLAPGEPGDGSRFDAMVRGVGDVGLRVATHE